jgi:hypothetical protein
MTCEFHVGELHKCSECVPGLLVCQAHLVACKGLSAGICPQCQRVLCVKHLDCFCSESKLWREEEKVRRNSKTSAPPSGFSRPGPSLLAFPPLVAPVSSCSRASSCSFLQGVRDSSVSAVFEAGRYFLAAISSKGRTKHEIFRLFNIGKFDVRCV